MSDKLPQELKKWIKLFLLIGTVLSYWFIMSTFILVVLERVANIKLWIIALSSSIIHLIFGSVVIYLRPSKTHEASKKISWYIILVRGIFASLTIFTGSIISRTYPEVGGFVSCFPAIYLTTMISMWISHGENIASGATGPMILGSISVSLFSISWALLYPLIGWITTTIVSYGISIVFISIPITILLRYLNKIDNRSNIFHTIENSSNNFEDSQIELEIMDDEEKSNEKEELDQLEQLESKQLGNL